MQEKGAAQSEEQWEGIGAGTYNYALRNANKTLVFKIEKRKFDQSADSPERSVRLWNLINPDLYPPAALYTTKVNTEWKDHEQKNYRLKGKYKGWTCPYVEGEQASDAEIKDALLDIFNRTGRIIPDGIASKNFVKRSDGKIICIDIGMALQLEKRAMTALVGLTRTKSFISLDTWEKLQIRVEQYLTDWQHEYPKANAMTEALLFIKAHRPDITDASFLKDDETCGTLASAYIVRNDTYMEPALALLESEHPSTFENIKQACRKQFEDFLKEHGVLNLQEQLIPHSIIAEEIISQIKSTSAPSVILTKNHVDFLQRAISSLNINAIMTTLNESEQKELNTTEEILNHMELMDIPLLTNDQAEHIEKTMKTLKNACPDAIFSAFVDAKINFAIKALKEINAALDIEEVEKIKLKYNLDTFGWSIGVDDERSDQESLGTHTSISISSENEQQGLYYGKTLKEAKEIAKQNYINFLNSKGITNEQIAALLTPADKTSSFRAQIKLDRGQSMVIELLKEIDQAKSSEELQQVMDAFYEEVSSIDSTVFSEDDKFTLVNELKAKIGYCKLNLEVVKNSPHPDEDRYLEF